MYEEIKKQLDRIERYAVVSAKQVLNLDELVFFTGFSKGYIYKLTYKGEIPHYKAGGRVFFDRDEVNSWLKQVRVSTNKEVANKVTDYEVAHI